MTNSPHPTRFEVSRAARRLRITFASTLENIDRCDGAVAEFIEAERIPIDRFAIRILLREALLNAVTHGNGEDPARDVDLTLEQLDGALRMTVQDDGPGFAWHDRDFQFDILGDGGRGLPLMQMYADHVYYNDLGNSVVLERALDIPADVPNQEA